MNKSFSEILEKAKAEIAEEDLATLNSLLPKWNSDAYIVGTRDLTPDEKYVMFYCLKHDEETAGLIDDQTSNSLEVISTPDGPKIVFFNQWRSFFWENKRAVISTALF